MKKILLSSLLLILLVPFVAQGVTVINATWTAPTGGITVEYYQVQLEYDDGSGFVAYSEMFSTSSNTTQITMLVNDHLTYKGRVRAVNQYGAGEWSEDFIELAVGAPSRPADIAFAGTGGDLLPEIYLYDLVYYTNAGQQYARVEIARVVGTGDWEYRYSNISGATNPCPFSPEKYSAWTTISSGNVAEINTNISVFPGYWLGIHVQVRAKYDGRTINDFDDEGCTAYVP